jgi:hypothetical protein
MNERPNARRVVWVLSLIVLLVIVAVVLETWPSATGNARIDLAPTRDPAFRLRGLDSFATQYPQDWEQRLDPTIKPMVEFQRLIGAHARVVSYADNEASPSNPNPKFRVFVVEWDGTDLFAAGVPRTYHGKPVEIVPVASETTPLGG